MGDLVKGFCFIVEREPDIVIIENARIRLEQVIEARFGDDFCRRRPNPLIETSKTSPFGGEPTSVVNLLNSDSTANRALALTHFRYIRSRTYEEQHPDADVGLDQTQDVACKQKE